MSVRVMTGISSSEAMSSHQNATLQNATDRVTINVATQVSLDLPEGASQEQVADAVRDILAKAVGATDGALLFTVQVGPDDDFRE